MQRAMLTGVLSLIHQKIKLIHISGSLHLLRKLQQGCGGLVKTFMNLPLLPCGNGIQPGVPDLMQIICQLIQHIQLIYKVCGIRTIDTGRARQPVCQSQFDASLKLPSAGAAFRLQQT